MLGKKDHSRTAHRIENTEKKPKDLKKKLKNEFWTHVFSGSEKTTESSFFTSFDSQILLQNALDFRKLIEKEHFWYLKCFPNICFFIREQNQSRTTHKIEKYLKEN